MEAPRSRHTRPRRSPFKAETEKVKTAQNGLLFFTRRARRGAPRPVRLCCEPAVMVRDIGAFIVVLTSRPIYAGAPRRQHVAAGQFLNLSRLGQGSPADLQTLAQPERDGISA